MLNSWRNCLVLSAHFPPAAELSSPPEEIPNYVNYFFFVSEEVFSFFRDDFRPDAGRQTSGKSYAECCRIHPEISNLIYLLIHRACLSDVGNYIKSDLPKINREEIKCAFNSRNNSARTENRAKRATFLSILFLYQNLYHKCSSYYTSKFSRWRFDVYLFMFMFTFVDN